MRTTIPTTRFAIDTTNLYDPSFTHSPNPYTSFPSQIQNCLPQPSLDPESLHCHHLPSSSSHLSLLKPKPCHCLLLLLLYVAPTFFLIIPSCNSPHHRSSNIYGQTSSMQIWAMSFVPPYFLTQSCLMHLIPSLVISRKQKKSGQGCNLC